MLRIALFVLLLASVGSTACAASQSQYETANANSGTHKSNCNNCGANTQIASGENTNKTNHKTTTDKPEKPEKWLKGWTLSDEIAAIVGVVALLQFGALVATVVVMQGSSHRQLRAYVFAHGWDIKPRLDFAMQVTGYDIVVPWQNMGQTPARRVRTVIKCSRPPFAENREPDYRFDYSGPRTSISDMGPGAIKRSTAFLPINVVEELWFWQTEIYVGARVEYFDAFNRWRRRHHELWARLELNDDPRVAPIPNQIPIVDTRVYGPNNTSS